MKKITKEKLSEILEKHKKWLNGVPGGKEADLRGADLRGADLRWCDLRGAKLFGANLSGCELSGARTDKRYISITCIGSRKGITIYCFDDDIVWCGCWEGTLKEFKKKVLEEYPDKDNMYHKEYIGFIKYIKSLVKDNQ